MVKLSAAYRSAYIRLNNEQKRAVNKIDGPILVIAGPGTGKTQLLSTRIGHILEATDSAPENILCLTFSEAAARNMQQRLAHLIGMSAYDVTVSTYHGFGSDLIRNYLNQDIQPADDLSLDQLLRSILDNLDYSNPLKSEFFVSDLKELISGYKRALITPDKLRSICDSNERFMTEVTPIINSYIKPKEKISLKQITGFQSILEESERLTEYKIEDVTSLKDLWLEELSAAITSAEETKKMTLLSKWKANWLENDNQGLFTIKSKKVINRQRAAAEIFSLYNQALKDQGLYDYDDMIMFAINGLQTNPDLKYTLQERYLYILLDEFQDTNEAQLKLVELLADNPINENRPNILAVGDDDQAIYSFQGAHYSHMQRFFTTYSNVELINLKVNYRSTPSIVSLSTAIRSQIKEGLNLAPKELVAEASTTNEEISRTSLPLLTEHLAWTAEKIKNEISSGTKAEEIAVLAPKHSQLIELIPYLHAQGVAISYEQKDNILEDDLINEILNAARLVIALSHGREAEANALWPMVLSYSYWQLPASLLWEISWQARNSNKSWSEIVINAPRTRHIALFFIRLSQIAAFTSFELILNYLVGSSALELNETDIKDYQSPFYERHFNELGKQSETIAANEWRLLGHLSILRSRAKASSEDGLNIEQLIKFIDSYNSAGLKIVDTSPFQESAEAINLMTAYAAKGREFKTVFLIDLIDSAWGSSARGQSSHISLPPNLKQVRLDRASDDERLRLLFVAVSRAKEKLFMVGYLSDLSGKETTALRYLEEYEQNGHLISPFLPAKSQIVTKPKLPNMDIELIKPAWFNIHLDLSRPERRALLKEQLKLFKLSATKLNAFSDISRGGPGQFYLDHILRFPTAPSLYSQFGSAIHGTLDWQFKQTIISKKIPNINKVINEFDSRLKKQRLGSLDYEQQLKRGSQALNDYFKQTTIINNPEDFSEESFWR